VAIVDAANGPALTPPGPPLSRIVPLTSRARLPVLCTGTRMTGVPAEVRLAAGVPRVKADPADAALI
jgi:hypothetical protein